MANSNPSTTNTNNDSGPSSTDEEGKTTAMATATAATPTATPLQAVTKLFAQQNIHDVPPAMLEDISSEDREESLYDVHGVLLTTQRTMEETPELIRNKLLELDHQLMRTSLLPVPPAAAAAAAQSPSSAVFGSSTFAASSPPSFSSVDDWATSDEDEESTQVTSHSNHGNSDDDSASSFSMQYSYLQQVYQVTAQSSPEFMQRLLLSCLRAENWDVRKATRRVLKHLEAKLNFFGVEALGKDLGIDDLKQGPAGLLERNALFDGAVQVLRHRDRSGRAIIAQFSSKGQHYPVEVMVRTTTAAGSNSSSSSSSM